MNVKRFYVNMFHHSKSDIPSPVLKNFKKNFHHPIDVEWIILGNDYEALFYENNLERIARFDSSGKLIEVRTNIPPLDQSVISNKAVMDLGDLMNYIQIRKGEQTTHELIIKKPDLTRMLVLLNENFEIIKQETL